MIKFSRLFISKFHSKFYVDFKFKVQCSISPSILNFEI
ncbi:hypothetical protein CAMGR0001_2256 [Campylobacter gracilis RM3268]|uniref:Uncharacterized protein n=1 Tax=Campylobacter gracilis RM3268 TaxID=553220 RepID=C8PH68_9BACT|nr:hypothetical protein CAMGR0001_2256 [Campylobacter gracilis RM3268]